MPNLVINYDSAPNPTLHGPWALSASTAGSDSARRSQEFGRCASLSSRRNPRSPGAPGGSEFFTRAPAGPLEDRRRGAARPNGPAGVPDRPRPRPAPSGARPVRQQRRRAHETYLVCGGAGRQGRQEANPLACRCWRARGRRDEAFLGLRALGVHSSTSPSPVPAALALAARSGPVPLECEIARGSAAAVAKPRRALVSLSRRGLTCAACC